MALNPRIHLQHRTWAVWLVVLIAVFAALAPTLSHGLALARSSAGMEADLCVSAGVSHPSPDAPEGPQSAVPLVHCPLCLLTSDRMVPPPLPWGMALRVPGAQPVPVAWPGFFSSTHFELAAAPRGPPDFLLLSNI